jgi:predicted transcriptional regulator
MKSDKKLSKDDRGLDWKKYGYVISSGYRQKVILGLTQGPKTPKQISIDTKLYLSHVSHTLKELSSLNIVICLTPELRRGRVYKLTKDGREIAAYIKGANSNASKEPL